MFIQPRGRIEVTARAEKMKKYCKDCIFFIRGESGQRGGVKGKCRIRRPNEIRAGSRIACRMFGKNQEN